jgi:hypothetical protein
MAIFEIVPPIFHVAKLLGGYAACRWNKRSRRIASYRYCGGSFQTTVVSAGERSLHTGEVVGSIPTAPTTQSTVFGHFLRR